MTTKNDFRTPCVLRTIHRSEDGRRSIAPKLIRIAHPSSQAGLLHGIHSLQCSLLVDAYEVRRDVSFRLDPRLTTQVTLDALLFQDGGSVRSHLNQAKRAFIRFSLAFYRRRNASELDKSETCIFPGSPVVSMRDAMFTASPQMSYKGFCAPTTPAVTSP